MNQRHEVAIGTIHAATDELLRRGDCREEGRLALTLGRGLEPDHHAGRSIDEQCDATARIRDLLARKPGERVGQCDREERDTDEEQQQRQMTHERERRTAHDRQHGRQRHLRSASLPQHSDHQYQDHDRQQNEEDEQGAVGPLELQVVPPSAHPLVPRGAQCDREILQWWH